MGKAKVEIHPAAGLGPIGTKNPPIDADKSLYLDSAAGDAAVTSTWAQIKAFLKTYFDTLYAAIGLAHNRLHPITSALDHSSAATPGRILRADGNGLPVESANTDAELADAVVKRHTQNTDTNLGAVGVKNPPIDTDKALYRDSAAADALVTSTWTQIKAFLKTYFDTIYGAIALAHSRQHSITSTLDHISAATPGKILKADANGLPVDATNTDIQVAATVALAHARQHAITSAPDHTSTATPGKILKADANGLPVDASNTDAEVADAVTKKHTQGTDVALGALGTKNPPIDADKALYRDSAAGDALVTSTWTQIKAFLKTHFDTIYGAIALAHTQNTDIRIQDADGDTKIQVEESADEDKIRMDVKGVEAFLLNDVGVLTLAKQSGCKAYRTGALSVPRGSYQKINLNAEIFDIQSEFDTGTYKFTAKTAGLYLVVGTVGWNDYAANAEFDAYIFKNGVSIQGTAAYYPVAAPIIIQCTTIASLAVNDYLELYTYCGGSGTAALVPYEPYINLYVAKIA